MRYQCKYCERHYATGAPPYEDMCIYCADDYTNANLGKLKQLELDLNEPTERKSSKPHGRTVSRF